MKKSVTVEEFERVLKRNAGKSLDVWYTDFAFYFITHKCRFTCSCRSTFDRLNLFALMDKLNIIYSKQEVL